jgi:hypothetical protein
MAAARTRELSVYDGQEYIGTIKLREDGEAIAFDQRGKRLGSFPSLKAASSPAALLFGASLRVLATEYER